MHTITIDGEEFQAVYVEKDDRGRRTGIVTTQKTFWLDPVCDYYGFPLGNLPELPPEEIISVSLDEASAPKPFLRGLLAEWQAYRQRWMASTTAERGLMEGVCVGHDKYGSDFQPDHRTPDLSWRSFKDEWFLGRTLIVSKAMQASGDSKLDVGRKLRRIRFLASYPDPDRTRVFLAAVKPAPHSREEAQEVRSRSSASSDPARKDTVLRRGREVPYTACRMVFVGAKRWKVAFPPHEPFFAVDNGFGRELAYVLQHPHHEMSVLEVQFALTIPTGCQDEQTAGAALDDGLSPQAGTHRIKTRKLSHGDYMKAHEQLEGQRESARAKGDPVAVENVEAKLEQLESYQADAAHSAPDWTKLCADRMRVGLNRLRLSILRDRTAGGLAFLEHEKAHLTFARYKLCYHPPEGYRWEG
jgi:hypothetical protein